MIQSTFSWSVQVGVPLGPKPPATSSRLRPSPTCEFIQIGLIFNSPHLLDPASPPLSLSFFPACGAAIIPVADGPADHSRHGMAVCDGSVAVGSTSGAPTRPASDSTG